MIEAHVICLNPCDIPDLGIRGLKRGEERWISIQTAQHSRDLKKEQAKGNVRWSRKARRMEKAPKRPPPPFVARSRPAVPEKAEPPPTQIVERVVEVERVEVIRQEVDTEELARQMKAELLGDLLPGLQSVIAEEVGKAMASHEPQAPTQQVSVQTPGMDAEQMAAVMESVMRRVMPAGGGGAVPGGRRSSGPEEPLFIPDKIVAKDAKAKIDVKSQATEGTGDLDDAQAALRALKRKKRGRKNVNEENES